MSAYDDAVAYLDAKVHQRCDYDIYSDMRDIVDEMEAENEKLRELIHDVNGLFVSGTISTCELCDWLIDCANHPATSCRYGDEADAYMAISDELTKRMRKLGIEVE